MCVPEQLKVEKIEFRLAQAKDAGRLADLVNSAYRGESSKKGWTTEADLLDGQRTDLESLQKTIEKPNQVFLTAWQGSQMIGSVFLEKRGALAYLGMLTVSPNLQAKGLGRTLLEASEDWVKENWGAQGVEMTVITSRMELIQWYVRRGYQLTGRKEPFPYGDEKFGVPKVPDLEFVVLEKKFSSASNKA